MALTASLDTSLDPFADPTDNVPAHSEARMPPHLPLPFPKGCGRARTFSTDKPKTEKDGGGSHEVGGQYEDTMTMRGGIDSDDEGNGWQGGGRNQVGGGGSRGGGGRN